MGFSYVSVIFTVIQNKRLATNSRNAILNNFEEYCILYFIEMYYKKLVGCFGFNGPLRQYFRLYRAVSQREGERGEKG